MNKKIIVITGGAGFIGSNLIKLLLKKTNFNLLSIDNYSSGSKLNHIQNKRVKYIKAETQNIDKIIKNPNKVESVFHFGEFSRIYQSFLNIKKCLNSNSVGTNSIINFCLKNKIRLIYSATSASLGNSGSDKDLSPYAFTKAKNLELLNNLKKWFNFKCEIIYFYNVYGPGQISSGKMATVIGIFENQFKNKKDITVVKPGTQTRRFTHVDDTILTCFEAWKKKTNSHYSIFSKKSYSIIQVAKMFKKEVKFLSARKGERFASALTKISLNNKIKRRLGKIELKDYILSLKKNFKH
jgi:UDP-glucose 4-epimerase